MPALAPCLPAPGLSLAPRLPLEPISPLPPGRPAPTAGPRPLLPSAARQAGQQFEQARAQAAVQAMRSDPALMSGLARWATLDEAARWALLRRLVSHLGDSHRFTPAPMELLADAVNGLSGSYDEHSRRIGLARAELMRAEPRAVVDSVLHEQLHAYQHQKIVQGQQGALPPGSPLRELAPAWGYNMDHYVSATADSKAYAGQPLERHAFSNAARITQGLFAPSPRATPRGPAAPGACDPATPPAAIGSPVRGRSRFSLARQVARAR